MKKKTIPADDTKAWRKEALRLKKELEKLTSANIDAINSLDGVMKQPTVKQFFFADAPMTPLGRERAIAKIMNALEMANDSARHFGLGISFKSPKWLKDKRPKT
jgi:hypothetical protein